MRSTTQLLLFPAILFIAVACASKERLSGEGMNEGSVANPVLMSDVLSIAESVPSLFKGSDLKSGSFKEIKEIKKYVETDWNALFDVKSLGTNELLDDLYIVDYAGGGFALISTNPRSPQVLAYAESGNVLQISTKVSSDDLTGEFTIYDILALIPYYYEDLDRYLINYPTFQPDSTDIQGYYYCAPYYHYKTFVKENYSTFSEAKWGQDNPYNTYCYVDNSSIHAKAGCVPIAVCQVMSYLGYPEYLSSPDSIQHNTPQLQWESYKPYYSFNDDGPVLAELIRKTGDLIGVEYGENGSGASFGSISNVFSYYGISSDPVLQYNTSFVASSLQNGRPVLASGAIENPSTSQGDPYRHTWVIEGYRKDFKRLFIDWDVYDPYGQYVGRWTCISPGFDSTYEYVYCNWGWDGEYNGYYISGAFNTPIHSPKFDVKIITGIHHE